MPPQTPQAVDFDTFQKCVGSERLFLKALESVLGTWYTSASYVADQDDFDMLTGIMKSIVELSRNHLSSLALQGGSKGLPGSDTTRILNLLGKMLQFHDFMSRHSRAPTVADTESESYRHDEADMVDQVCEDARKDQRSTLESTFGGGYRD